jgi:5'-phosphate synthase pdxT subunit
VQIRVGVLGLQGDYQRHVQLLEHLGVTAALVRRPEALAEVDGLIIPGGESTTIGKLMQRFGLLEAARERAADGMPVFGTCAGAILLAREILGPDQPRLGLMDIAVERNAYGRQIESFEVDLEDGLLDAGGEPAAGHSEPVRADPVRGVFIRAPIIRRVGGHCSPLLYYGEDPVVVQEGPHLVATFHPELVGEARVHRRFLELIRGA